MLQTQVPQGQRGEACCRHHLLQPWPEFSHCATHLLLNPAVTIPQGPALPPIEPLTRAASMQLAASRSSGLAPLKVQRPFQQARRPLSVAVRAQVRPGVEGVVRACTCGHTGGSAGLSDCLGGSNEHFGRPVPRPGPHPPHAPIRSSRTVQRFEQQQPSSLSATFGSLAAVLGLLSGAASPALAADFAPPPTNTTTIEQQQTREFAGDAPLASAPSVFSSSDYQLPEGTQWRYSEFINAVKVWAIHSPTACGGLHLCTSANMPQCSLCAALAMQWAVHEHC